MIATHDASPVADQHNNGTALADNSPGLAVAGISCPVANCGWPNYKVLLSRANDSVGAAVATFTDKRSHWYGVDWSSEESDVSLVLQELLTILISVGEVNIHPIKNINNGILEVCSTSMNIVVHLCLPSGVVSE